jgi:hypothetical protein
LRAKLLNSGRFLRRARCGNLDLPPGSI